MYAAKLDDYAAGRAIAVPAELPARGSGDHRNNGGLTVPRTLQGAVAVVTGASSGIGEARHGAFAAEGAKVALLARRQDRLDTLVRDIAAAPVPGSAYGYPVDVSDADTTDLVLGRVAARGLGWT